jgi:SNF2 family DNA or RNA helicase
MALELFPYQDTGANWIATRRRSGLLDEPGLGKTAQVIRAIDLRRSKRGLIVCPARLVSNWIKEHTLFAHMPRKLVRIRNIHDLIAWQRGVFDVAVASYEMAVRLAPLIHDDGETFDFMALDEGHYCSRLDTLRTKAVLGENGNGNGGLAQWAEQTYWITGTLMVNDPAQCYTFLRFVRALELSYGAFLRRYFYTRTTTYGERNTPRVETLPELQMLLANNSIRRTFADVGIELPPIHFTSILVDGDTDEIKQLLRAHPGMDTAIVHAVEQGGLSFLDSQHIATMRRLIAEAKALPYAEMLLDELRADPERKVVVMGNSREALKRVQDYLAKHRIWAVLLQGGVSAAAADAAVTSFQSNPLCRVFVGNIHSAGVGLTLTAAAHIDMLESDWAPKNNEQAIKRIRRIGQHRTQHARFITLARSLDEAVNRVVAEKTKAIAMVEGSAMIGAPDISATDPR